jgi:hypothetical protein
MPRSPHPKAGPAIKHKFTVTTSCNKYTDAGRENTGSVKDILPTIYIVHLNTVLTL